MPATRFAVDHLAVSGHPSRREAGVAAAGEASAVIRAAIDRDGRAAVVFAAAPSQNEFLAELRADSAIDWRRVTAFHLDEYAGLPAAHPASFRRFLRERLVDHVPLAAFHELAGDAPDLAAEASRYRRLLAEQPPALVALGIGENGHLAFKTPGNAISTTRATSASSIWTMPAAGSRFTTAHSSGWKTCRGVPCRSPFRFSCAFRAPW